MSRFAYQPLIEENSSYSKPGQLIMNRYNAHISINRNNLIISITKEIEDKISTIVELQHDIDEQYDVVLNLIEDYQDFLNNTFLDLSNSQNNLYVYDKKLFNLDRYLSKINNGMKQKIIRIETIIDQLIEANTLQNTMNENYSNKIDELYPKIDYSSYIQKEYNELISMKSSYFNVSSVDNLPF